MKSLFKGWFGETMTSAAMWIGLDENIYHRLNNVTLPKENGMTTQIDHIIVSRCGIFVIETKNYQGWIFGNAKQEKWTQVLKGGKKFQFYNPIRQNYGHIKTLSRLLGLEFNYFHGIVWFGPECELKTKEELPDFVLNRGLIPYIKTKNEELLSEVQVRQMIEKITHNQLEKGISTYLHHQTNVRKHLEHKKNNPVCPYCQGEMVKRISNKSRQEFLGCRRYPQCRGTRRI